MTTQEQVIALLSELETLRRRVEALEAAQAPLAAEYVTSAPTDTSPNGLIKIANLSGSYYLYAVIDGAMRRVILT
jgi:hypothetical protein